MRSSACRTPSSQNRVGAARRLRGAGLHGAAELLRGAGLRGAGLLALLLASLAIASCGGGKSASTSSTGVAVAGGPAAASGTAGTTTSGTSTATPAGGTGAGGSSAGKGATSAGGGSASGGGGTGAAGGGGSGGGRGAPVSRSGGQGGSHAKRGGAHGGGSGRAPGGGGASSGSGASPGSAGAGSGGSAGSGGAGESSYVVTSLNMEPTYPPRTTVRYNPTRTSPIVGDVVLFHLPLNALERGCGENPPPFHACQSSAPGLSTTLAMGRVVGVPGDSLAFKEGNAILNGTLQHEASTKPCGDGPVCSFAQPIVVPADSYYILYDNRAMLDDSRVWGAVPQGAILGTITGTQ